MNLWLAEDGVDAASMAARLVSQASITMGLIQPRVNVAFSGGSTPAPMLAELAANDEIPWAKMMVWQVDERIAPDHHRDRNHTQLTRALKGRITARNFQAMPVGQLSDAESDGLLTAAHHYSVALRHLAGRPPVLDVVHLGLGSDGHTASLLPYDDALDVTRLDVTISRRHQGRRRMTLTAPVLQNARRQVWLVSGTSKAEMVRRLAEGDQEIPAGRVITEDADVVLDHAAAAQLPQPLLATARDIRALL